MTSKKVIASKTRTHTNSRLNTYEDVDESDDGNDSFFDKRDHYNTAAKGKETSRNKA
jgi:hypothetical protein